MSRIQNSLQPCQPCYLLQGGFSASPGTHLSNPGLARPRGGQGRVSEVWLGAKRALLALHSSAALQPQSLKCFFLFFWLTSSKLSWLFKTFLQQKNHPFYYPNCCSPIKKSPGRRERGAVTSSLPWLPDERRRRRSHTCDRFPSTFHQPHLPPTEIAAGTSRTPYGGTAMSFPCLALSVCSALVRGMHSRPGTGAAPLQGGYWLPSGYWRDPEELCLV